MLVQYLLTAYCVLYQGQSLVCHAAHIPLGEKKTLNEQYIACQMVITAMKKS